MSIKEYLIKVKKHYETVDKSMQMGIGVSHFQEFVQKYHVNNYVDLSLPFIKYLNGRMGLDEFVRMVK